jgi:hypothetical protein
MLNPLSPNYAGWFWGQEYESLAGKTPVAIPYSGLDLAGVCDPTYISRVSRLRAVGSISISLLASLRMR